MNMRDPDTWAVIPARGGSKGIPRKNLQPVGGIPLLARTILAAKGTRRISRVIVSTDDVEIEGLARRYGAEVVHRPADISGDRSSSEETILHALETLRSREDTSPHLTVFLQCTSPFVESADLDGLIDRVISEGADCGLMVTDFLHFPWRATAANQSLLQPVGHEITRRPMRQERKGQEFLETGSGYVFNTESFKKHRSRFFGKITSHWIPPERAMEIDEPLDLAIAETVSRFHLQNERIAVLPEKISAVVFDFDGVMTPNTVLVSEAGEETVVCNRGDGMGISLLRNSQQVKILCLSTERNPVVSRRCEKLRIDCLQDSADKGKTLQEWLQSESLNPAEVIYVGNDVNDRECLTLVGCPVVVRDAHPDVVPLAKIVLSHDGGKGAVREICDLVLKCLERTRKE